MTKLEYLVNVITKEAAEHKQPPDVTICADLDVIRHLPDAFGPVADDLERMSVNHYCTNPGKGVLQYFRHQLAAETVAKDSATAFVNVLRRHGLTATTCLRGLRYSHAIGAPVSTIIVTLKIAATDGADEAAE